MTCGLFRNDMLLRKHAWKALKGTKPFSLARATIHVGSMITFKHDVYL